MEIDQPKRAKTSRPMNRKKKGGQDEKFVRLPMFDEIQKLVASQKILDNANADTVGWDMLSSTKDPVTGLFVGNPQSQALKSREHVLSTFKNRPVTHRLNVLSSCHSRDNISQPNLVLKSRMKQDQAERMPVMLSRQCGDFICNSSIQDANFDK